MLHNLQMELAILKKQNIEKCEGNQHPDCEDSGVTENFQQSENLLVKSEVGSPKRRKTKDRMLEITNNFKDLMNLNEPSRLDSNSKPKVCTSPSLFISQAQAQPNLTNQVKIQELLAVKSNLKGKIADLEAKIEEQLIGEQECILYIKEKIKRSMEGLATRNQAVKKEIDEWSKFEQKNDTQLHQKLHFSEKLEHLKSKMISEKRKCDTVRLKKDRELFHLVEELEK